MLASFSLDNVNTALQLCTPLEFKVLFALALHSQTSGNEWKIPSLFEKIARLLGVTEVEIECCIDCLAQKALLAFKPMGDFFELLLFFPCFTEVPIAKDVELGVKIDRLFEIKEWCIRRWPCDIEHKPPPVLSNNAIACLRELKDLYGKSRRPTRQLAGQEMGHWALLRKKKLERDRCCQICTGNGYLQLHHKNYDHFGFEEDDEVILLCSRCHGLVHSTKLYDLNWLAERRNT